MNAIHKEVIANGVSTFMRAIGQEMDGLLTGFEKAIREDMQLQVNAVFGPSQPLAQPRRGRKPRSEKPRKKLDMQCRHADGSTRCAQLSKGPRFSFLCHEHVATKPKRGRKLLVQAQPSESPAEQAQPYESPAEQAQPYESPAEQAQPYESPAEQAN